MVPLQAQYRVQVIANLTEITSLDSVPAGSPNRHTWWARPQGVDAVELSKRELSSGGHEDVPVDRWSPVKVPGNLLDDSAFIRSWGIAPAPRRYWYRKVFVLPGVMHEQPAVRFGVISDSDRVYLNGVLIGQSGSLDSDLPQAYDKIRLYRLPMPLLRPGARNILLLETKAYFPREAGIKQNRTLIGPAGLVFAQVQYAAFAEIFFLICYATVGMYFLFLFFRRRKERENLLFALFCLALVSYQLLRSQFKYETGWDFFSLKRIEYLVLFAMTPIWFYFVRTFFELPRHWLVRACDWSGVVSSALLVACGVVVIGTTDVVLWDALNNLVVQLLIWPVMITGTLAIMLERSWRGNRDAQYMTLGFAITLFGLVVDVLSTRGILNLPIPRVMHFTFLAFILSVAIVLANRFVRVHEEADRLNQELGEKNKRLARLDQLKNEFLANTSHELRTPLNGIIGIADSLIDGAAGAVTGPMQKNLGLIASSGRRLAALINDILDFSKLRNRDIALSLGSVDLRETVEVVLAVSRPLTAGKAVTLVNDVSSDLPAVRADENRLQQILHNLVGNAVKFAPVGSVSVSAAIEGSMIEVCVSDTGMGIPPEKHESIFQSFEQGDATTERTYGGTGLGLSITKQLVELHGGRIRVESEVAQGARFLFTLPLSGQAAARSGTSVARVSAVPDSESVGGSGEELFAPAPTDDAHVTVLVVDDEPVNRQVLTNLLGLRSYRVIEASDGPAALQIIEQVRPDIVLLDVMMPLMNGYEVCARLRRRFTLSELPVILLTAKNQVGDLVEGMNSGANDYLPKPFNRDELLARMSTHLQLLRINGAYTRFVPAEFMRFLGKESVLDVRLGDQTEREMTVLFSDLRDFSSLSESMTPAETFAFLNAIFRRVGPVVREHGGFIDKFIGDAIMALFPTEPAAALDAALAMQSLLAEYNQRRAANGYVPVAAGFGIHTGTLMLGTIGEVERMDSTVISDAVNLASRLEGLSKVYGASIVISETTFRSLPNQTMYSARFLDHVKVKGKQATVSVLEVFGGEDTRTRELKTATRAVFEQGITHYHLGEFSRAGVCFEEVLVLHPEDRAAAFYLRRAGHYMVNKPPPDWESAEIMGAK